MKLLAKLRQARALHQTLGNSGVKMRLRHEVRKRAGRYRDLEEKTPPHSRQRELRWHPPRDFYSGMPTLGTAIVDRAQRVLAGELTYFSTTRKHVGWPPSWHRNPHVRRELPSDAHWSELSTDYEKTGDIKWVWEPSRFGFAPLLARAYAVSNDPVFVEALWGAIGDWRSKNPFGYGANWQCGQETSLRYLTIAFSLNALGECEMAEPIAQLAYDTGRRVASTLDYALSQRNNHAISELVALWFISAQFPDWDESRLWNQRVCDQLPRVLSDQFLPDGSYIQESFHYQRLALQLLLFAKAAAQQWQVCVPAQTEVDRALQQSFAFLARFVDPRTGLVPNTGPNDGTHLFAVSECGYNDFRPVLCHLASALGADYPCGARAAWEEAAWFGYPTPETGSERQTPTTTTGDSSYLSSWRKGSLVFVRAPQHFHHRPWHADALHVDVHVAGKRVTLDPGTYLYTAPAPWQGALQRTRVHNTCSVDDVDQMRMAGKFLWSDWSHAHVEFSKQAEDYTAWGLHVFADWQHTVHHRRLVIHGDGFATVIDQLRATNGKRRVLRLHWNLYGNAWLASDGGCAPAGIAARDNDVWVDVSARQEFGERMVVGGYAPMSTDDRSGATEVLGWWSPSYGQKLPCTALELEVRGAEADFTSQFRWHGKMNVRVDDLIEEWRAKPT